MNNIENILMCPNSHENLKIENSEVRSTDNKYCYKIEDGIYRFLNEIKSSETENVKKFYMEDPFPNYNSFDNLETFIEKMKNNSFINSISKILKPGDRVLEFGCGTGQLGNYLAANGHSEIFSADLTINSLKLGNEFTKKNNIKGINFFECDVFKPCFKNESFDLIICSGVLHHTIDPKKGFNNLLKMLKKNGLVIIGLYNSISRLKNSSIKYLSKIIGDKAFYLFDKVYRAKDSAARNSWVKDQYDHPLEKRYFFKDLHNWFDESNIEFINSIPSYNNRLPFEKSVSKGDKIDQFNIQLIDLIENDEGGLFTFLGKKN
tara:strand:+ start:2078 stop:3034 length:957 start_codon:yes stop_codon:yes gene_type:complete